MITPEDTTKIFYIELVGFAASTFSLGVNFYLLLKLRAQLKRVKEMIAELKGGKPNGDIKYLGEQNIKVQWTKSPVDGDLLCLMGQPFAIRRTAIGKNFRLLKDGNEIGAYDDANAAMDIAHEHVIKEAAREFLNLAPDANPDIVIVKDIPS